MINSSEHLAAPEHTPPRPTSGSTMVSSGRAGSSSTPSQHDRHERRTTRTLPPWIRSVEADDAFLGRHHRPQTQRSAEQYRPQPNVKAETGRKWDYRRERAVPYQSQPIEETAHMWRDLALSSLLPYPGPTQIVDEEWMRENMADLDTPYHPETEKDALIEDKTFWLLSSDKRKEKWTNFEETMLRNPLVPLFIRIVVLTFSILALGLAATVQRKSDYAEGECRRRSSTIMAIVVGSVAITYTVYITYDEYFSKPLGLRSASAKLRLVLLDLIFIIFNSANLALAFYAVTDTTWACKLSEVEDDNGACAFDGQLCTRQKALVSALLVSIVAWATTFVVSMFRLVHRVERR